MGDLKKTLFYISFCLMLSSCEFKCNVGKDANEPDKPKTDSTKTTKDGTILTNDISLSANGFKVRKATLLYSDESKVPEGNTIGLNMKIRLHLSIDSGWQVKNGKVFLGASESITTDAGQKVVDAEDLFKDYDSTGISPEDAKLIKLSAIIQEESVSIKYYTVNFRVWDKNSDADITGHYRFYIKH